MKLIVAFALLAALLVIDKANGDDVAQGVAGFPTVSLSGSTWKTKVNKMIETFNNLAGSNTAYATEEDQNVIKITGDIIVVTKDGETPMFTEIYINRFGRVFEEIGREIMGARGIVGGSSARLNALSESALEKMKEGFKKTEGFVSSLQNDIWIFGKSSFNDVASIATNTAKMITELGVDTWSNFKPISQANQEEISKMVQSGMNLALEPAKIFMEGAGAGFNAMKNVLGVAAGVPLAMGSSMARSGADLVSTGAGLVGKMADNARGYGQNMAGLKTERSFI